MIFSPDHAQKLHFHHGHRPGHLFEVPESQQDGQLPLVTLQQGTVALRFEVVDHREPQARSVTTQSFKICPTRVPKFEQVQTRLLELEAWRMLAAQQVGQEESRLNRDMQSLWPVQRFPGARRSSGTAHACAQ